MAQRVDHHPLEAAYPALIDHGLDGAGEALRIVVNEASKIERAQFLNACPFERTPERADYANGFKSKTVMTRVGEQSSGRRWRSPPLRSAAPPNSSTPA